jgi:hypothetical protein
MKKMNMYEAPKAEIIEMQAVAVLSISPDGTGNDPQESTNEIP